MLWVLQAPEHKTNCLAQAPWAGSVCNRNKQLRSEVPCRVPEAPPSLHLSASDFFVSEDKGAVPWCSKSSWCHLHQGALASDALHALSEQTGHQQDETKNRTNRTNNEPAGPGGPQNPPFIHVTLALPLLHDGLHGSKDCNTTCEGQRLDYEHPGKNPLLI